MHRFKRLRTEIYIFWFLKLKQWTTTYSHTQKILYSKYKHTHKFINAQNTQKHINTDTHIPFYTERHTHLLTHLLT